MPIISTPHAFHEEQLYIDLRRVVGQPLYLKCEGFNFAGSVKLKAALSMVEAAERDGVLKPDSILIESSSGNLGIALAMIAASKGYRFLCVSDSHSNPITCKVMQALGAQVHVITVPSVNGGFLGARLEFLRSKLETDSRYVWLNQYKNENNWGAHYHSTGPAIARSFPGLDVLFIGAGTCGTLTGCARYFRDRAKPVRIVAIDAVGSVTFGGTPSRRLIPGLGTAVRPAIADESLLDELLMVEEEDTIRMCRQMASHGFLFGGSSGTVVSGAVRWMEQHGRPDMTCVAISPDFGERYIDSIYQDGWVRENYSEQALMLPSGNGTRWAHGNGQKISA